MKYGLYLPNFGEAISAQAIADLASEAESAGWNGFFLWDHILYSKTQTSPMVDPWIALTAAATQTKELRLGTTVTPLARRRPWVLARTTATLDQLSNGRVIISVGLGEPAKVEFSMFGEQADPKIRAEKLDESLDILNGLWKGEPFSYKGKHYQISKMTFQPPVIQKPRIPIWVGGFWPNKAPFRRAALWDGVIPLKKTGGMEPDDVCGILQFINTYREIETPFDFVIIGNQQKVRAGLKGIQKINAYNQAGATWWLESLYTSRNSMPKLMEKIRQGPPV